MAKTRQIEELRRRTQPRSGVYPHDGKVVLTMEMPGMSRDDVKITVENDELKVQVVRPRTTGESNFIIRERSGDDYFQVFTLDDSIDRNKIEASMQRGVLTVELEQNESSKRKQIAVR